MSPLSGSAGQPRLVPNHHFVDELFLSAPHLQNFAIPRANRHNAFLLEFREETPPADSRSATISSLNGMR